MDGFSTAAVDSRPRYTKEHFVSHALGVGIESTLSNDVFRSFLAAAGLCQLERAREMMTPAVFQPDVFRLSGPIPWRVLFPAAPATEKRSNDRSNVSLAFGQNDQNLGWN